MRPPRVSHFWSYYPGEFYVALLHKVSGEIRSYYALILIRLY